VNTEGLILPDWPAPENVMAMVSTRENAAEAFLQQQPAQFLQQVHGARVFRLDNVIEEQVEADAIYTQSSGLTCVVRTADCLPVFFSSADGRELALAHAGWRGLAAGVLENTLANCKTSLAEILVWLGPAIAACHFEVGPEVREIFLQHSDPADSGQTEAAFLRGKREGKWQADLYALARIRLLRAGINAANIHGGGLCTYCDAQRFYSYRRDGEGQGRLLSLLWRRD
tara:strand:- start:40124 stop:40807 length:684 start_codon:yes stop_codon:yes gene_type:complete